MRWGKRVRPRVIRGLGGAEAATGSSTVLPQTTLPPPVRRSCWQNRTCGAVSPDMPGNQGDSHGREGTCGLHRTGQREVTVQPLSRGCRSESSTSTPSGNIGDSAVWAEDARPVEVRCHRCLKKHGEMRAARRSGRGVPAAEFWNEPA